jgi:hypothetical protein
MMDFAKWRHAVVDVASQIADAAFQERAWFGRSATEVSSPDELVCQLFDDLQFEQFLSKHASALGCDQEAAGRALVNLLNDYLAQHPEEFDTTSVFHDPEWQRIRDAAARFVRSMKAGDPA